MFNFNHNVHGTLWSYDDIVIKKVTFLVVNLLTVFAFSTLTVFHNELISILLSKIITLSMSERIIPMSIVNLSKVKIASCQL